MILISVILSNHRPYVSVNINVKIILFFYEINLVYEVIESLFYQQDKLLLKHNFCNVIKKY